MKRSCPFVRAVPEDCREGNVCDRKHKRRGTGSPQGPPERWIVTCDRAGDGCPDSYRVCAPSAHGGVDASAARQVDRSRNASADQPEPLGPIRQLGSWIRPSRRGSPGHDARLRRTGILPRPLQPFPTFPCQRAMINLTISCPATPFPCSPSSRSSC